MGKQSGRITIKDIAQEAGVSITTVSRFLNHEFKYMSEDTKSKIDEVIRTLNYKPNPLAQGLKGLSRTVSIVVTNLNYPLCISVIREVSKITHDKGFNLLVCETDGNTAREESIFQSLVARSVDGIIIQTNGLNNRYIQEIAAKIPVVFFDREYDIPYTINLVTNNMEISEQLTVKLFEEGYGQVLYITEQVSNLSTRTQRLEGYKNACKRFNLTPWVETVNHKDPASFKSVIATLEAHKDKGPFAVYTANGLIMLKLYPYLRATNYTVPFQMGLATFDRPDWADIMTPELTCIDQPAEAMGQLAATTLLKSISTNKLLPKSKRKVIDSKLVISGSSKLEK